MMTGEQYVASIKKMRPNIYKWGKLIEDVTTHPATRLHVQSVKRSYDLPHPFHEETPDGNEYEYRYDPRKEGSKPCCLLPRRVGDSFFGKVFHQAGVLHPYNEKDLHSPEMFYLAFVLFFAEIYHTVVGSGNELALYGILPDLEIINEAL